MPGKGDEERRKEKKRKHTYVFVRVQLEIRFHLLVKEEQNSHALIIAADNNALQDHPKCSVTVFMIICSYVIF